MIKKEDVIGVLKHFFIVVGGIFAMFFVLAIVFLFIGLAAYLLSLLQSLETYNFVNNDWILFYAFFSVIFFLFILTIAIDNYKIEKQEKIEKMKEL